MALILLNSADWVNDLIKLTLFQAIQNMLKNSQVHKCVVHDVVATCTNSMDLANNNIIMYTSRTVQSFNAYVQDS